MSDWLRRLQNSRRARNLTFLGIGVVGIGSCAGAAVANYTVAGMNTMPYRGGSQLADSDWSRPQPEWVRDAAYVVSGRDAAAGFPAQDEAYSDASY